MQASEKLFDRYHGHKIKELTLTNDHHVSLSIITLGATVKRFACPDRKGKVRNIILSLPTSADDVKHQFFCQAVGRTAGRITDGTFSIDGKTYHVDQNEGTTTLHGGPNGFNTLIWNGSVQGNKIVLTKYLESAVDSFPGNIAVKITWTLNNDNVATVTYTAQSDADTLFNPTQHMYFNLGDKHNVYDHILKINADRRLQLNPNKTPTGKMLDVAGDYDFRRGLNLGDGIIALNRKLNHSYDDIYVVNSHHSNEPIATLADPSSGRQVSIFSKRNALVIYTPDSLKGITFDRGKGHPYLGVALEAQTLSDAPNHRGFGSFVLPKGAKESYSISYQVKY